MSTLRSLAIEVTNRCNLSCPSCYGRGSRPEGDMSWELCTKVMDQAAELELESVGMHFNGEPTAHPRYAEILRYGGKLGLPMRYSTNGIGVTEEIAQATLDSGVKKVNFSVHGPWKKAIENARRLLKMRGSRRRPRITASMIYHGQSPQEINELWSSWQGATDTFGATGQMVNMKWRYLSNGAIEKRSYCCSQPLRYVAVLWDGRLTICCRDLKGELVHGNVSRRSLAHQLRSPRFCAMREQIKKGKVPDHPQCRSCGLWQRSYQFPVINELLDESVPAGRRL